MAKLTFFDLLGVTDETGAAAVWPRSAIGSATGLPISEDPDDYLSLMQFLQESLSFTGVRSGSDGDQHGFWAELHVEPSLFPLDHPLVAANLPEFAFALEATGPLPATVFVTRSRATGAPDIVIQGLPVRLVFPLGYLEPQRTEEEAALPPPLPPKRLTDAFDPAAPDSLEITLSDAEGSFIRTRVNVRLSAAGDVYVDTAVPVSIGPCYLLALPCRAVHDMQLVPAPALVDVPSELPFEWKRHSFEPTPLFGLSVVTFRTIELDPTHPTIERVMEKIRDGRDDAAAVEFVFDDVAVAQPIPLHGRFGLRRAVVTPTTAAAEMFNLNNAPARIEIGPFTLFIYRLLLQTVPLDGTELPIAFDVSLAGEDAEPTGGRSLAVSVNETGVITATFALGESDRPRLFTLAGAAVHLAAIRLGVAALGLGKSVKRPGIGIPVPSPDWAKPLIAVADFVITPGNKDKLVEAKSRSDQPKARILHDAGWSLGKISLGSLEKLDIDFTIAKKFRLRIEELGFVTEADGGNYLVVSASVGTPFEITHDPEPGLTPPSDANAEKETKENGFGLRVHRLRFLIEVGDDVEGRFLLDGLSLWIRTKRFELLGFGMVSHRDDVARGNRYEEMGFELKLRLEALSTKFELGVQFFHGSVTGTDNFTYWMFGFELGTLPIGSMELSQLRVLAVKNMTPKLDPPGDGTAAEMRLLRWYKRDGDALSLRLDRKLAAWMPLDASVAGGVGASLTLAGTKAVRIGLFAFAFDSPDASGVLIGLELYLAKAKQPIAFGALEWHPDTDKWGLAIGLNLSLRVLLGDDAPKWIVERGIGASLTGLFYTGNQPDTLAIGQYNDIATWLALQFQIKVLGRLEISVLAAFCRHTVDRPEGPRVTGVLVQAKGQLSLGVGKLQFYATFSWISGQWRNEAISAGDVFLIEAGVRIRLFRVFNFGASIKVEISQLGPQDGATYNRKSFKVSVETPWYLPDVTIRWERIDGTVLVDRQAVISPPLVAAAAFSPGGKPAQAIGYTPLTTAEVGNPDRVYSLSDLRAAAPITPTDADFAALPPVSVDSTIALDHKPSLDAEATPLPATPPDAGTQAPSDLTSRYILAAVGVRRRALFGDDAGVWKVLVDPASTEAPALDNLPPVLVDAMAPVVGFDWDADVHREGRIDPRRLLVNARTPYSFTIGSAASDELVADAHPRWPCCERFPKPGDWHRVDWSDTTSGTRAPVSERFTESASTFQWLTDKPPLVVTVANDQHAARIRSGELREGLIARARFDDRAFECQLFATWTAAHSNVSLVVEIFDGLRLVDSRTLSLGDAPPTMPIRFERASGFTAMTLRRTGGSDGPFERGGSAVAVTLVRYRTVEEERDWRLAGARCQAQEERLTGVRRFAWLPNHDYEIELRTRVELSHAGSGTQSIVVPQVAYFRTKGLPGLNAVAHVGEEVEPYIESRYPRAEDRLYRREALAVAFNERFNILAPVDRTPVPHAPIEAGQMLKWALAVEKPTGALGFERVSVTSADWLTTHRGTVGPRGPRDPLVHDLTRMRSAQRMAASIDPMRVRFEHMQTRTGGCQHPRIAHVSQVLTHEPVDVASPDAAIARWEADTEYRVNLRRELGPFIERARFDPLDVSAVSPAAHAGPFASWNVVDGAFESPGGDAATLRFARFGEATESWMHVQVQARVRPGTGAAGLAVAVQVAGTAVTRGFVAIVDASQGDRVLRLLEIEGASIVEREHVEIGVPVDEPVLELIAFDDAIVASVGDARLSTPRGSARLGTAALVVRGDGAVASLGVTAVDGYRLTFRSSRYDDFPSHIGSADEPIEARPADVFGVPQTSVSDLLARTRAAIDTAMRPGAPAEARERLMETWADERALLFQQSPDRLSIVRTVEAGGTPLIVFEGPEPLAFSRDVTLTMMRRTQVDPLPPGPGPMPPVVDRRGRARLPNADARDEDPLASAAVRWLASFEWHGEHLLGAVPPRGLELVQRVVTIEAGPLFLDRVEYRIVRPPLGERRRVEAVFDRRRRVRPTDLPRMRRGDVLLMNSSGPLLAPVHPPFPWPPRPSVFVPQPLVVLTDGNQTRGIVIPVDASGAAVSLGSGTYRFTFAIDRERWRTDVPDATSNYRAEVTFDVSW